MFRLHISDINQALKNIKSNTFIDFIHKDQRDLIITTNIITSSLDLDIIEKYVENIKAVQSENIVSLCLL